MLKDRKIPESEGLDARRVFEVMEEVVRAEGAKYGFRRETQSHSNMETKLHRF